MGMAIPFRIKGGLKFDEGPQMQVFPSDPTGAKADALSVGSLAVAKDSGKWFRKTTIGAGSDKWAALTTSQELAGIAPSWREPVFAVETRAMTLADAKDWINKREHIGGAEFYSNKPRRVLFTNLTDSDKAVYNISFYPQAKVVIAQDYELRSTLPVTADTTAGNSLTYAATINNPANATATTCTIVGNDIRVNLKNDGSVPTATIKELLEAIEAADTSNLVYMFNANYTDAEIRADIDTWTVPDVVAVTNFAGGSAGNSSDHSTRWEIGTTGQGKVVVDTDEDGDWNDFILQTRTDTITDAVNIGSPAAVAVGYDTLANAKGDMDGDNIFGGVAVTAGLRVYLFGLINGVPSGVYVVSGTSGNWTLTFETPAVGQYIYITSLSQWYRYTVVGWDTNVAAPPTMTMDGNASTYCVINEDQKAFTIHLGNNGTAITATVNDVKSAVNNRNMLSVVTQLTYNDYILYFNSGQSDSTDTVVAATAAAFGSGGVGGNWGFQIEDWQLKNNVKARVFPGDAVYVERGFHAGATWIFNDSNQWVKQGASSAEEMGRMQNFVGKSGDGNEMPGYSSTNVVTQSASLEAAIGQLDAEAGDTMTWVGKSKGDTAPNYGTTNAVTQSANLKNAVSQIDLEIGYLQAFLGKDKGNDAPAYTTTKVVGQGTNLETAVSALDDLLGAAKKEGKSSNVTTQVVADSILMEQDLAAEWMIHVREVANPSNVYTTKVFASHNADVGLAATVCDFSESSILEMGSTIPGLSISMDVEVSGPLNARAMRLLMAASSAVNVTMSRQVLRRQA
ncbi:MAG: hypothetical protein HQL74_12570 [Magnetococcales bacterium]|nr:hypothetical protein [Magnetococcales bacterium]